MEPVGSAVTIKETPYKKELYELAPELYSACKQLIMHKNIGELHTIDFQRIEQLLEKIQTA